MLWSESQAKARFNQLLEAALQEGPQIITRRGVEAAVLVSIDEWNRLKTQALPSSPERSPRP